MLGLCYVSTSAIYDLHVTRRFPCTVQPRGSITDLGITLFRSDDRHDCHRQLVLSCIIVISLFRLLRCTCLDRSVRLNLFHWCVVEALLQITPDHRVKQRNPSRALLGCITTGKFCRKVLEAESWVEVGFEQKVVGGGTARAASCRAWQMHRWLLHPAI